MKNFAKLMIFFTLTFALFFLAAIMVRFVSFRIDLLRTISAEAVSAGNFAEAAWTAIPAAFYFSILFSLAFSAREKIHIPLTMLGIVVMGCVFTAAAAVGLNRIETLEQAIMPASPIRAEPGLIVSRAENSIVLLRGSTGKEGPRLVAIPGQPLIYQQIPAGPNNTTISLPALPFGDETPWFIRSMGIDLSLGAGELKTRFGENFLFFTAYAFSIILLLASLRFLFDLSKWPLANVFLGALIFRFILSLEVFLNSREINALVSSFLDGKAPPALATPLIFSALGALIIVYTLLAAAARREREADA